MVTEQRQAMSFQQQLVVATVSQSRYFDCSNFSVVIYLLRAFPCFCYYRLLGASMVFVLSSYSDLIVHMNGPKRLCWLTNGSQKVSFDFSILDFLSFFSKTIKSFQSLYNHQIQHLVALNVLNEHHRTLQDFFPHLIN